MMTGSRPFFLQNDQLCLIFKPILPGWLFNEENNITYKFLGQTTIIYHNPKRKDTFDQQTETRSIILNPIDGNPIELTGGMIPAPYAQQVRDGMVKQIDVYFV
jgi:hypothetical protein